MGHRPAIYAVGDLHGEVTLPRRLLGTMPIGPDDTLVFLGDYRDRGEDSAATIATLRDFARCHGRAVFLRGYQQGTSPLGRAGLAAPADWLVALGYPPPGQPGTAPVQPDQEVPRAA